MKIITFALLILFVSSYNLNTQLHPIQGVNWPFSVCGNGTWTMKNLTLGHVVTRNADDDVDAVILLLYRSELPTTTLSSSKWISRSP